MYNGDNDIIKIQVIKEKTLKRLNRIRKDVMDYWSSINIDTKLDWEIAEIMAAKISYSI